MHDCSIGIPPGRDGCGASRRLMSIPMMAQARAVPPGRWIDSRKDARFAVLRNILCLRPLGIQ